MSDIYLAKHNPPNFFFFNKEKRNFELRDTVFIYRSDFIQSNPGVKSNLSFTIERYLIRGWYDSTLRHVSLTPSRSSHFSGSLKMSGHAYLIAGTSWSHMTVVVVPVVVHDYI